MDAHRKVGTTSRHRRVVLADVFGAVLLGSLTTLGLASLVVPTLIVVESMRPSGLSSASAGVAAPASTPMATAIAAVRIAKY